MATEKPYLFWKIVGNGGRVARETEVVWVDPDDMEADWKFQVELWLIESNTHPYARVKYGYEEASPESVEAAIQKESERLWRDMDRLNDRRDAIRSKS